jgi:Leucine-rich repeat (LRR) protein
LEELNLANNQIKSIDGLEDGHNLLKVLDLSENLLDNLDELRFLADIKTLRTLKLLGNPMIPKQLAQQKVYRLRTIHGLSHLTNLDEISVSAEEKVAALNKYSPPAEVLASNHHVFKIYADSISQCWLRSNLVEQPQLRPWT